MSTQREDAVNVTKCDNVLSLSLVAVILPPVAVGLLRGWGGHSFWLCVILTILGYIPGCIYAMFCVLTDPHLKAVSRMREEPARLDAAAVPGASSTS